MAWIDDRIWCAPKLTDLTSPAFRAWVNGIAYSSGMHTRGRLTLAQQRLVGANAKTRSELIEHGLWDLNGDGLTVHIHDWDEHNEKRDARRARDRERKRLARLSQGASPRTSTGTSTGTSEGTSKATARVDGSEGSDGYRDDTALQVQEGMEGSENDEHDFWDL